MEHAHNFGIIIRDIEEVCVHMNYLNEHPHPKARNESTNTCIIFVGVIL